MSVRYPIFAITHIHTEASNGEASELDDLISGTIRSLLGQDTPARWSECFTTVDDLLHFLRAGRHRPPVGIITVTDHMNMRSHTLPDKLLRAAAAEPRLATCAEITTAERDIDGVYRRAPEVLVYGGAGRVDGPHGPHYGLSQQILDDIFSNCRVPGLDEVRTSLVLGHCAARGLACALAHPFDGHHLSLEATLDLISQAQFVETVNGGFPAVSTRILEDLISFQNRVVSGWRLNAETAARYPLAQRLQEKIIAQGRSMLHPWGGSDAHHGHFARVVNRFLAHQPAPPAGDLFGAMLGREVLDHLIDGTFSVHGKPGSTLSVVDDVVHIVLLNIWRNRPYMLDSLRHALPILYKAQLIVRQELGRRAKRQESLVREAARRFNSNHILQGLQPPDRTPVRPVLHGSEVYPPPPPDLPAYIIDARHVRRARDTLH